VPPLASTKPNLACSLSISDQFMATTPISRCVIASHTEVAEAVGVDRGP
jgi:hypothetical protein